MTVLKGVVKNGMVKPLDSLPLPEETEVLITFPLPEGKGKELDPCRPKPFPIEKLLSLPRLKIGGDAVADSEEVFDE
jgi:hypothetical protein